MANPRFTPSLAVIVALIVTSPSTVLAQGVAGLGDVHYQWSFDYSLSGDGKVVAGTQDTRAFRWTPAAGVQTLALLAGDSYGMANGISGDGAFMVGVSAHRDAHALRWAHTGEVLALGALPGDTASHALAISRDGTTIVGISGAIESNVVAHNPPYFAREQAFRWTPSSGMQALGYLSPPPSGQAPASRATAVSADGSVVAGSSNYLPFRWTQATGMQALGILPETAGYDYRVVWVSADGNTIYGYASYISPFSGGRYKSFRWTQSEGMRELSGVTEINAVSADGSVLVGANNGEVIRWTQATGAQAIANWLQSCGYSNLSSRSLWQATGISSDGNVVVGTGTNPSEGWIAWCSGNFGVPAGSGSSANECLLNWLEQNYPSLLSPAGGTTQTQVPYSYRYYGTTQAYAGISSVDDHLYYLGPATANNALDAGASGTWRTTAGCH